MPPIRLPGRARAASLVLALALGLCRPGAAGAQSDSATVVAGERYRAGSDLHAALLGRQYRDLWTVPIRVPVLDLDTFAGGLTPVETGGFKQTRSLRFRAPDGREYNFRSVDKEVTQGLPDFLKETAVDRVLQDLTHAQLPAAPVVATALLDAAGVLNPGPALFVLPDDPALGEFREEFAGMLGTLEVHANEGEEGEPLFAGSPRVVGTDRMLEYLEESPRHRVDARAFLRARLLDALVGDFDRHVDQWRWARFDRGGLHWWVPVPEDRDFAFVDYDGILPALLRATLLPRLVRFRDRYPNPLALMTNSLQLNRRLLAGLPRAAWDSAAVELQSVLSDEVIRDAVGRMPAPHVERSGPELVRKLVARRDRLGEIAGSLYETLAESVEIHATDEAERAEIERTAGGGVEVRLFGPGEGTGGEPYLRRAFRPEETEEVRLFLHGGDDRAAVSGPDGEIVVRVIGGGGDDLLEDRGGGPTALYDARGDNRFLPGPRTRVVREEYREPEADDTLLPALARDWGESSSFFRPALGWEPHAELVLGGGPGWTRFGFRHYPYAWRIAARGLYAPFHGRFGAEAEGDLRWEGSRRSLEVLGRAWGLDATAFHGLGNDSPLRAEEDVLVWHERYLAAARLRLPFREYAALAVGGLARYTDPSPPEGAPLPGEVPYGSEAVGQLGATAALSLGSPQAGAPSGGGAGLEAEGALFPPVWGVRSAYGRIGARAAAAAELPGGGGLVLGARAGGSAVLGDAPFFDAAFLGGWESLRGYRFQRFAGDRAVFAGTELRVPLARAELIVRGDLGVTLFADAGRVFVDAESPGGWHTSGGGSLWFATPAGTVMASYAHGEEHRFYLRFTPEDRNP